jgi:hypothetical protein
MVVLPLLLLVVAVLAVVFRRRFAEMQAMVLGGTIAPGCAVAEAIVLLALAVTIYFLR